MKRNALKGACGLTACLHFFSTESNGKAFASQWVPSTECFLCAKLFLITLQTFTQSSHHPWCQHCHQPYQSGRGLEHVSLATQLLNDRQNWKLNVVNLISVLCACPTVLRTSPSQTVPTQHPRLRWILLVENRKQEVYVTGFRVNLETASVCDGEGEKRKIKSCSKEKSYGKITKEAKDT